MLGLEIVQQTFVKIEMIQEKMKGSKSLQKSYNYKRKKALEFLKRDHVFLRVTLVTSLFELLCIKSSCRILLVITRL